MKLKKISSIILSMAMVISLISLNAFAMGNTAAAGNGAAMTVSEFNQKYVGENNRNGRSVPNLISEDDVVTVEYGDVRYTPETRNIQFGATITRNGLVSEIELDGTLYSSYKKDSGINSIVGKLTDNTGRFDVLRFEIYNDTDTSMLYALNTDADYNRPVLLLYLLDGEELYIFETEIPEAMTQITIANTVENKTTEGAVDGFWFENIAQPQMMAEQSDVMPVVEDIIPIYNLSAVWTISGVDYRYYASVEIYYRIVDCTVRNSTWQVQFEISDAYAMVNGERSSLTGLRITNLDIAFATGEFTKIVSGTPRLKLHDSWFLTDPDSVNGVLGAVAGYNYATSSVYSVLSLLGSSVLENYTIEVNRATMFLPYASEGEMRGFTFEVPSRYFLQHVGNLVAYNLEVTGSTFGGRSDATAGYRIGAIDIVFDYYVGDGTTKTHVPVERITGIYHCNPF